MKSSVQWRSAAQRVSAFALIFTMLLQTILIPQAVHAAPALEPNTTLGIVDVTPKVDCVFDQDCSIIVEDLTDHFTPPAATGDAFLQSRTWPIGEAGTPGENLYAYLYRIDLSAAVAVTAQSCVTSLKLDFGPISQLDYNGDQQLDDLFVLTEGGLGYIAPSSADLTGDTLTIYFDPGICTGGRRGGGGNSFFIGLASTEAPQPVVAELQGSNGLEQTLKARAPKRPSAPLQGKIAYVYKDDTGVAADFESFLESNGFDVTLVPLSAVLSTDFSQYDLTLVADDTGYLGDWGDAAGQVTQIANHNPVLGLGEGGYSFFGQLKLKIGWPHGWHKTNGSVMGYPTLEYYQTPNDLTSALATALPVYLTPVNQVGIHLPEPEIGVTVLGTEPLDNTHHPLIAQDCYQLWGFSGSPKHMSKEGQLLFINAVMMAMGQCKTMEQQCSELESPRQIPSSTLVNFDDLGDAVTIADHYVPTHGLHFYNGDDTKVITYADRDADPTKARSAPNVATNNAAAGMTSVNVPLRFWFDQPKTHVGFYMGNGENQNLIGTLIAYDATGQIICVVRDPVPEPYEEFLGIYDPAGRIAIVELNYGETVLSEVIDDLYFAPPNTEITYPLPEEPPFEVSVPLTVNIGTSNNTNFAAEFELPEAQLLKIRGSDGISYTQFILPGVEVYGNTPGLPDVPMTRRMLAVPHGATVKLVGLTVVNGDSYLVDLWPAQEPAVDLPLSQEEEDELPPETFQDPPFVKDAKAYSTDALFPPEIITIESMGQMRDVELVQLNIAGGQYNPATKMLQLFKSVKFEVVFEGGEGGFLPEEIVKNPFERSFDGIYAQVLNHRALFEHVFKGPIAQPVCLGYEYVIITHPDFRPAADALRDWKNSRGLSTVVRETGANAGAAGTTAAQIRNTIRHYYNTCLVRPSYVLLLGDAEFIPPFYRMTMYNDNAGTDLDYSLMNDADIMPDLAYGRIPVDTLADAQIVINKIINYEKVPPAQASFYSNVTVASYFQCCRPDVAQDGTASRSFVETAELIRNGLMNRGYTVERVYRTDTSYHNNPNEASFYNTATRSAVPNRYYNGALLPADLRASSGYAWDGNSNNVVNAFNAGRFLMLHRGHGGPRGWGSPSFGMNNLASLTNSNLTPVVYSINCASGLFDNETLNPAQQDWNYNTTVNGVYWAERLLRMEGGAVGIIGDTRNSPTWANSALARGLFDATFPNVLPNYGSNVSYRRLGDILNYGKAYMVSQVGAAQTAGSVSQNQANTNLILYHVFGDPSMKMWTSYPYLVVFPWYVYDVLTVAPRQTHVKYPINGATITALQDGNPIGRAEVVDGIAVIDFIGDADPNLPIELSAINPDGTGAELGTADATGDVDPQTGGSVEHQESKFKLTFGPGAVDVATNLFYNVLNSPSRPLGEGLMALRSFSLDAFDEAESDGNPAQVTQFSQPFTLVLGYSDEELAAAGVDEASLRCQYLDESDGQWKPINSQVDVENNTITCSTDHFSEFAVVAEAAAATSQTQLFLPFVTSN